jgi:Glyoxalase-like domain
MGYAASIDVPDLDAGAAFYSLLGFTERARPLPEMAVLHSDGQQLLLHQRAAGTKPYPGAADLRRFTRHWTPVHLDFETTDFTGTLNRLLAAGAVQEALFDAVPGRPPVAFLSDPFGHGFCLIGERPPK